MPDIRQLIERRFPNHDHLWDELAECQWVKDNARALLERTTFLPPPGDLSVICPSLWDQGKPSPDEIQAMERQANEMAIRIAAAKKKIGDSG